MSVTVMTKKVKKENKKSRSIRNHSNVQYTVYIYTAVS